jgi:hypothetical protein
MPPARDGSNPPHPRVLIPALLCALSALPAIGTQALAGPEDGAWRELGPPLRFEHVLVMDLVRDRVVVFGGYDLDHTVYGDVWVRPLQGQTTWQRIEVPGPAPGPRAGHSAIYDPVGDQILVFGGRAEGPSFDGPLQNDLWSLSFVGTPHWTRIDVSGAPPSPREHAHLGFDSALHRLYVMGDTEADAWSVDLDPAPAWTPRLIVGWSATNINELPHSQTPTPSGSWSYSAATNNLFALPDALGDGTLVWRAALGDSIRWFPVSIYPSAYGGPLLWTDGPWPLVSASPSFAARWGDFAAVGERWVGQYGEKFGPKNAVVTNQLTGVGIVWDAARNRALTFGGSRGLGVQSSQEVIEPVLWALDLAPQSGGWSIADGRQYGPLIPSFMVPDPGHDRILTIGSSHFDGYGYGNTPEVWSLEAEPGGEWTRLADSTATHGWPVAAGSAFAYDPVANRLVAIGEFNHSVVSVGLELDVSPNWELLSAAAPFPHGPSAYAFDSNRRALFVLTETSVGELWFFDLSTHLWGRVAEADLPRSIHAGYSGALALDPASDRLFLFETGSPSKLYSFSLTLRNGWQYITDIPSGTSAPFTITVDTSRNRMLMSCMGGAAGPAFWQLPLDGSTTWQPLHPSGAMPRGGSPASAYDPVHDRWLLHPSNGSDAAMYYAVQFDQLATPVLPWVDEATIDEDGAHVRWHAGSAGSTYWVDRDTGDGWQVRGLATVDGLGIVSLDDDDLPELGRVGYRLHWDSSGRARSAGEVWLDIHGPSGSTGVSLHGPSSNPARGMVELAFTLRPGGGTGTIQVVDAAGRERWRALVDPMAGGAQTIRVPAAAAWAPGVYFVRMVQGAQERRVRFALVR